MYTIHALIENKVISFSDFERFLHYYDIKEGAYYAEPPQAIHDNFYGKLLSGNVIQIFHLSFPYFKGNPDIEKNPFLAVELLYQPISFTLNK